MGADGGFYYLLLFIFIIFSIQWQNCLTVKLTEQKFLMMMYLIKRVISTHVLFSYILFVIRCLQVCFHTFALMTCHMSFDC